MLRLYRRLERVSKCLQICGLLRCGLFLFQFLLGRDILILSFCVSNFLLSRFFFGYLSLFFPGFVVLGLLHFLLLAAFVVLCLCSLLSFRRCLMGLTVCVDAVVFRFHLGSGFGFLR